MILTNKAQKLLAYTAKRAKKIVRPYDNDVAASHEQFARRMFPNNPNRSSESYIRWKYHAPTSGASPNFFVAVEDGEVVGQIGGVPVKMRASGQDYDSQWLCDLMVDNPEKRPKIGAYLLATAITSCQVNLGNDPTDAARDAMISFGMELVHGPQYMVLPVKSAYYMQRKLPEMPAALESLGATLTNPLMAFRDHTEIRKPTTVKVREGTLEEVIPLVQAKEAAISRPYVIHDEAFFQWRFIDVPEAVQKPHVLLTDDDCYAICEPNYQKSILVVDDWNTTTPEQTHGLFKAIFEHARAFDCMTIYAFANTAQEIKHLSDLRFINGSLAQILQLDQLNLFDSNTEHYHAFYDADRNI